MDLRVLTIPELERIGREIFPKLKGSPLAAKTLGRMLSMDLRASHWNFILESELWELKQEETDILPALRLSYMYLPFYLKQCFAFCAVYPKDYRFEKARLAEIWAAEGFVEPQGRVPVQDIGCQYFEDLVARSFFQKVDGQYVIHDLMHDMAQKVAEHDCFILRYESDFDKIPQNVRHLYVSDFSYIDDSYLLKLCKFTKLRTLICGRYSGRMTGFIMGHFCTKLLCMRVVSCTSVDELPDSIGNWKHLRYLEISEDCPLKSVPSAFCRLYNLQTLYANDCKLESLPSDFGKLIALQKFESPGLKYYAGCTRLDPDDGQGQGIRLIKNLKQFRGQLEIAHVGMLSKDDAAEAELKNKKYIDKLTLNVRDAVGLSGVYVHDKEMEVLEVLQPPTNLKFLILLNYAGVSLPSWFQPQNLPGLKSLTFLGCVGIKSILSPIISQSINLNEMPAVGIFLSLTDLTIQDCENLSSIQHFLHPDYVPAIKKIRIVNCILASIPTEVFGDLHFLEELHLDHCRSVCSQRLVSSSLKKLSLCGSDLFSSIDCCSLTYFYLSCESVTSIQLQTWSLPALRGLCIRCKSLISIGGSPNLSISASARSIRAFSTLDVLSISSCQNLSTLDDFLTQEYVPAIEKIHVEYCPGLLSLPGERFGNFTYLKDLVVIECPSLNWQLGLVLPPSLQTLILQRCGDISRYVPSCLQNLTSLVSLRILQCKGIISIPGDIWCNNLASLDELVIEDCPDLVSIGGAEAVAKIKKVRIYQCPNLAGGEAVQ